MLIVTALVLSVVDFAFGTVFEAFLVVFLGFLGVSSKKLENFFS